MKEIVENVILFNTFNSRFKSEEIEKFRGEIEKKGSKSDIFMRNVLCLDTYS